MSKKDADNAMQGVEGKSSVASIQNGKDILNKIKNYKRIAIIFAIALVIVGVLFTHSKLTTGVSGGMTPQSIREISQLATVEFRYRDVISIIEEEEFKLFGLWDIDPGEHILIVQYDGIIKLGIDCSKILFNEYAVGEDGKKRIEIKLPNAVLISSETPMNSFNVVVNKGVFTNKTVDLGVFYTEAGKRQEQHDREALNGEIAKTARDNAKKQLQAILASFSEIKENYNIVWVD